MTLIGSGTIIRKLVGSATLGTLAPTTTGGIEIDLLEGGDSASSFGGESPATVQITVRKDTNDNWVANNTILAAGEIGYIIEAKQLFIGDGVTAYQDLTDANYIVHWDEFQSALNDIGALQSKTDGQDTFLSQLQLGLNDHESAITTLQSDVSTLQSDLTTNVSGLQGQIDTLAGGVMKKYELIIDLSDIDVIAESNIDIITPTSGKVIVPINASVLINSTNKSAGQSAIRVKSDNEANIFETILIDDTGTWNGLTILPPQHPPIPLSGVDGHVLLYFTLGNTWAGSAGTLKLTIFYMEL